MKLSLRRLEDLVPHEQQVSLAADKAAKALGKHEGEPLGLLWKIKFEPIGCHPLQERQLNLIEQVNHTFTYLASFKAARFLFKKHPSIGGLRLNLGTASGFDIESFDPGMIAAEVFSAVNLTNNRKLSKDLEKVSKSPARHKYVFFCVPGYETGREQGLEKGDGVQVWSMGDLT